MATQQQCKRALDLLEGRLSRLQNVVGLGIVEEKDSPVRQRGAKRLAVAVYVRKKVPLEQLRPEDVVPPVLEIAGRKGTVKVPTRVIEQGEVTLEPAGRESP